MLPNLRIGDLIEIPSVQTVIRLESNAEAARDAAGTFVFTSEVDTHIQILAHALEQSSGQGYFLQGDFGSGKSHFLAALAAWLGGYYPDNLQNPILKKVFSTGKRFLPVTISLVSYRGNTPFERIITESIEESLRRYGVNAIISERSYFLQFLKSIINDPEIASDFSSRTAVQSDCLSQWIDEHRLEAFAAGILLVKNRGLGIPELPIRDRFETFEIALRKVKAEGFSGIVLLIDELSEFFRSKPDGPSLNEDARTLQLIGEISKSNPLWVIAAVQESIERTGDIAQATFRKIKDRFPVKFLLSTLHIRDLISKRLVKIKPDSEAHIETIYKEYCRHFPGFNFTAQYFKNIYPIHPLTLSLLEGLGDLFSQHRGIVDFVHTRLAGNPSGNIPGILDNPCHELLAPDAIYEHFSPRIAEFSSFYIYPSQIVPHLDSTIDACHSDESDRVIARRLIRILVLYAIHPTASPPTARMLAELAACMISFHDPDANAQYITEVLLDPLVEKSRFLNKNSSTSGNSLDATYTISTSDDQSKILKARIERTIKELSPDDTRIFTLPLAELPESFSWPGPSLWNGYAERTIVWRQSTRRVIIFFLHSGNENGIEQQINNLIDTGTADFAFVITTEKKQFHFNHTAIWVIPTKSTDDAVLSEYFSCRMVSGELRPSNPADITLIPLLNEQIRKLEPAARQAVLHQIYDGSFTGLNIEPELPIRQLKRFDRLLEIAGEQILENRYPRYKEIASRSLPPSLRYYQRLFDDFIMSGSISMREARVQGLSELIETLAVPPGLVEVKSGNYLLAPNTVSNQFLSSFFAMLPASGQIPLPSLIKKLQTGHYGVPYDLACFLLASLAYCGHISLVNRGRSLPLEFIKLSSIEQVEAVAPGDIICEADRKTITQYCSFLTGSGQVENFGLKMQREAWQAALKFKTSTTAMINDLSSQMQSLSGYSAFSHFDLEDVSKKCNALNKVIDEIKTSYSAREGLERFLASWRASDLTSDDIANLKQTHRFLSRNVEKIVFVNHYINHRSVISVSTVEKDVADKRDAVLLMLRNIDSMIIPDDGESFQKTFESFRDSFLQIYTEHHDSHEKNKTKPSLSKHSVRALNIVKRLASIQSLDCPRGTHQLIEECEKPRISACTRNLAEELMRSPLCSCGFIYNEDKEKDAGINLDVEIERVLQEYHQILFNPKIQEAISARSFAVRDVDKKAHERLGRLHQFLRENDSNATVTLRDLLDESTIFELNRALSGQARIENRNLSTLQSELSGRRLTPSRIREIVENWIGSTPDDTILSLTDSADRNNYNPIDSLLWPFLHKDLFSESLNERKIAQQNIQTISSELEQNFPSENLNQSFSRWSDNSLVEFICNEPVHLLAIQSAWNILANRIINNHTKFESNKVFSKYLDDSEAIRIKNRLISLRNFSEASVKQFPEKLATRTSAITLYRDSWSNANLKSNIVAGIESISNEAQDWFSTLPFVPQINISGNCNDNSPVTILLIDGISPDVWLDTVAIAPNLFTNSNAYWFRLSSSALTIDSINELFGFPKEKDPSEELALRAIDYLNISGDEDHGWFDVIPLPKDNSSQLIRLNLFDRQAHAGIISLENMAPALSNLLINNISPFIEFCLKNQRKLILTTDHGLSFSSKGLKHGKGGVYEKVIFRVEWGG